ncbi:DUF547 domain-containing protein [Porifericola rhodea]|uniref:DUF547 domain-containing protein n=1 Tax=Porifericola rhodea TaxID=930972 RepID=UPI002665D21C|nr:DUF547 domain-containing protein [Porifericola rhodea]WKN33581.1 DUF547 domain-containing protein [Porifericola rhodea]
MKHILIFLFCSTFIYSTVAAQNLNAFTQETHSFFQTYVKNGLVDYQAVKNNMEEIASLYQNIGNMKLEGVQDNEKKAFYINAYNLIVIHQIAKNYPVKSPMDIDGFFDKQKHKTAHEMLTLNALEKQKLLQPYQDARIHFVLVCAAQSCPPLASFAFSADQLEQQMKQMTEKALNNDEFIRVKASEDKVAVSKIFEWYQQDFLRSAESTLAYINQYRKEKIPEGYSLGYYEYDWTLNDN